MSWMDKKKKMKALLLTGILPAALLFLYGCAAGGAGQTSVLGNTVVEDPGPVPLYLDFGDVLLPGDLDVKRKSSFLYRTPSATAGVLMLSGRTDVEALIPFFENNMVKDNWRIVSSFKSPRTIMLFHKENRWCIINISEGEFNRTTVEIWVAPTEGRADSAAFNP